MKQTRTVSRSSFLSCTLLPRLTPTLAEFNTPTPSHPSSPDSSRYTSLAGTSAGSPASAFRSFPATPFMPSVSPLPSRHGSIDFAASPPLVDSPVNEDGPATGQKGRDSNGRWLGRHVPSPVERGVEKVAGIGVSALQRPLQGLRDAQLKGRVKEESTGGADSGRPRPRRSIRDEHDLKGEPATVAQPDETMRAQLNGLDLDADVRDGQNDPDESEQTGDAVIRAARHRDADMRALLLSKEGAHAATADGTLDLAARDFKPLEHDGEVGAAPEQSGALMLDMSGYKVPGEKNGLEDKATRVEQELEGSVDLLLDESASLSFTFSTLPFRMHETLTPLTLEQKPRRTSSRSRRRSSSRPTRPPCATSSRTTRRPPTSTPSRPSLLSTSTTPRPSRASASRRRLAPASVRAPAPLLLDRSSSRSSTRSAPRSTRPPRPRRASSSRRRPSSRSRPAGSSTSSS